MQKNMLPGKILLQVDTFLILGITEAKKTGIVDTFLDLGRNLVPDNLFKAAFQSVKTDLTTFNVLIQSLISINYS